MEDDRTGDVDDSILFAVAAGAARHLTDCTTVFANASYGRRHPSLAERLQISILDGITVFPNEDLEEETSINAEVGVKQTYFNRFTFQAAVFGHFLGDYIGRRDVGPDQVWDNLDDVFLYGAETSASWRPDPCRCEGLELFGTAGITLSSDEDVIADVPVHGRVGARYSQCVSAPCGIRRWFLEGAVRGAAESDAFDGTGGDAFVTSELFAGVGWASGGRRNAFLTVGVTNLLDEDYVELGSRLPAQGRSFQASLQFDF
jgi:outer membrane receptor protein involved in Fe transport